MTLQATGIRHAIGGKTILDGIDLTAHAGEVTAIVGPNGSGKTTLLRVLTGEDRAHGTVTLNDVPVTPGNAPRLATMRGVLPQASRIAFPFKVAEVVRIGLHSGPHGRDTAIAERALEAVDLATFADRFYQELSGGEQQRVQLARVLAQVWQPTFDTGPCWLFLDEPVASLDIGHQLGIMQLARDYALRGGGVITVMHDLNLTAMFADRIAVMKGGRIIAHGSPDDVLTDEVLSDAYGCRLRTSTPPPAPMRYVLPQTAGGAA
ncbi:heme ABC transporter ATP-binding protein [Roseovarius indicus]|uniref:heme ABC transporter ATP-binding protein n=1 Tax=Roseovarius indicus TaxID=540747 RepID=UPI0032EBD715